MQSVEHSKSIKTSKSECPHCETSFPDLTLHMRTCHEMKIEIEDSPPIKTEPPDLNPVTYPKLNLTTSQCPLCYAFFLNNDHLQQHLEDHKYVKPEKSFKCAKCPKSFRNRSLLTSHSKVHSKVRYQCDVCGRTLKQLAGLKVHKKNEHNPDNPLDCVCIYCGRICATKKILSVHIDVIHRNLWQFPCDLCGKIFNSVSALNEHNRKHVTMEPLFACEIYPEMFPTQKSLFAHVKTHVLKKVRLDYQKHTL